MKPLRRALLILWCLAYMALGRDVTVAWDVPPVAQAVTSWRVWSAGQVLATVTSPQARLTLSAAAATVTVTAINTAGESVHSQPLAIPAEGPRVWIQTSEDLVTWSDVVEIPYKPRLFIRAKTVQP